MKDSYGMEISEGDLLVLRMEDYPFEFVGIAKKEKGVWMVDVYSPYRFSMDLCEFNYIEAKRLPDNPLEPVSSKWEEEFWKKFLILMIERKEVQIEESKIKFREGRKA